MFIPNGKADLQSIINFEHEFHFQIPDDYRKFLQDSNGGACKNSQIKSQELGDLLIDYLFGLDGVDELNLRFWKNELKSEIPQDSLIIGSDSGGGFLLLCLEEGLEGIYYYDHSYLFESSSDTRNTYFIFSTFHELYLELKK
ncbi:SMI1/KNR4 family protein [Rhodanobacter spathiphylli]|uniref:Knr4/Smi1-like domain-containing protein n=1 Tax=Rhodanobacter spathiphylli B39 TaxID=1163407 RepID=I4VLI6_9GAMM|nr:SMI1/KNR4 family protein [Rhodanobacter spathiphylli]EIL88077.1 hypothetical protein UU7_17207 [Rhodanobacter spathiphylli B39]